MARSVEIARAYLTLEANTKGLEQSLTQAEKSLGRTAAFIKAHPQAAIAGLSAAAIGAAFQLVKMAEQTNKAIGVIADRVPGASTNIDGLREAVNRMAITYGLSQDQVIETMGAASEAGQQTAHDLLKVTEAAIQAGRALGINGTELVDNLDTALDIFGITADDAAAATARFFGAAEGRTSLVALLDSLSKLAPVVRGTGIDALTAAQALSKLIADGFEPGKKVVSEFRDRLKDGGVPAIQALAAQAPIATEAIEAFTAAINKNSNDIEANTQRAQSQLKAALVELGNTLTPIIAKITTVASLLLKTFFSSKGGGLTGAMIDLQVAAATMTPAVTGAAKATGDLGVAGGIAAGGTKELTATLIEARNATKDLSTVSVPDLKRYKSALEESAKAGKLDSDSQKALSVIIKELTSRRKEATKAVEDQNEILKQLQQIAGKAQLELLSASQREYEEVEQTFREKMLKLTGENYVKAEALLKKTHQNQLLAWAGLTSTLDKVIPAAYQTTRKEMELTGGVTEDFTAVLEKHGKKLTEAQKKAILAALGHQEFKDSLSNTALAIANGVDALGGFLEMAGLADEKTRALTAGVGDLAEGIAKIGSGKDIFGGILQGLGGLAKALGGLFGESESERQLRVALDKNRERLEDLSREVGNLNINLTGSQIAGTQGALQEFFDAGGALAKGWGDRLGAALLKRGLTMADLDEVAKTLQIELRPTGHLSPQALQQLMKALGLIEPTEFSADFRGQLEQLRHETELFDLTATEQAKRLAAIGGGQLKGATAAAVGGLDFSSADARKASLAILQSLFTNFKNIPTGELGGLQPSEFLDLLADLKDLIESANEEVPAEEPAPEEPPPQERPPSDDPIPVEDPIFTPNLEASNWEQLLGLQVEERDLLQGILDRLPEPGIVQPPPLPVGALGSLGVSGALTVTFEGPIILQTQPGDDGESLAEQMMEFIKSDEGKRVLRTSLGEVLEEVELARGLSSVRF